MRDEAGGLEPTCKPWVRERLDPDPPPWKKDPAAGWLGLVGVAMGLTNEPAPGRLGLFDGAMLLNANRSLPARPESLGLKYLLWFRPPRVGVG